MSNRERAISLLGQGYGGSQVAAALGVTPALISQYLDEPAVRDEVARLRAATLTAAADADIKVDSVEKTALEMVEKKLPFVRTPLEAARIFSLLNNAKRKTANSNPADDAASTQNITLTLPAAIMKSGGINIQLNSSNQVVDVDGRSMATLPSRALPSLAASRAPEPVAVATDVTSRNVPSIQQIGEAAKNAHQRADAARAATILENIKSLTVRIDGVDCVI